MKLSRNKLTVETDVSIDNQDGDPSTTKSLTYYASDGYEAGDSPAMVGGSAGFVMSGNYQSIRVAAKCELPAKADPKHIQKRTEFAFYCVWQALNKQAPTIQALADAISLRDADGSDKKPPIVLTEGSPFDDVMKMVDED
jgi:hypothetical protein